MIGKRTITYTWQHFPTGKTATITRQTVGEENYLTSLELINRWNSSPTWKYVLVGETWS